MQAEVEAAVGVVAEGYFILYSLCDANPVQLIHRYSAYRVSPNPLKERVLPTRR